MAEELYIIGGLVCILLVLLILRIRKKSKAKHAVADTAREPINAPKAPPPLPMRRAPCLPPCRLDPRALSYPKCPIDRSRNEAGKPQKIFWDSANNCYTCCHGHRFTGRE